MYEKDRAKDFIRVAQREKPQIHMEGGVSILTEQRLKRLSRGFTLQRTLDSLPHRRRVEKPGDLVQRSADSHVIGFARHPRHCVIPQCATRGAIHRKDAFAAG